MTSTPKSKRQKRPGIVPDDPEQFQRFVEAARELGIEEVGEEYERAVDAILRAPKPDEPMRQRIKGTRRKKERP
jgi:hypothetical protein